MTDDAPAWHAFPAMAAAPTPFRWMFSVDERGWLWLWVRTPSSCHGYAIDPESSDLFDRALRGIRVEQRAVLAQLVCDLHGVPGCATCRPGFSP